MNTPPPPLYLGLDIAKLSLELSPHPSLPKRRSYPNTAAGHRSLITALQRLDAPVHLICEATGGYEHHLLNALHEACVAFSRINPRQVRDFARAKGLLAKTDAIDAAVLAAYGAVFQPAPAAKPEAARQRLSQLVSRRQELLTLIGQEQNRSEHHHDAFIARQARVLRASLQRHLLALEAQIATLEKSDETLHSQVTRLCSVQGIGQRTAWMLLASLPELGSLQRGQAAALAGLAPYNHDSGPHRGQRHIAHGRPAVRRALYMAALVAARCNPVLRPLYLNLTSRGKPAKIALVALMRKLVELANLLLKNPSLNLCS